MTTSSPVIVIVGGVAGGASAAARARRHSESAHIIVLERGPDVSFANCGLPYHLGGEIPDRDELALQTPASLRTLLNLDVRTRHEAAAIDRAARTVSVRNLESGALYQLGYDFLILAPGAAPLRPPLPGIDDPRVLTLRNLEDMDRIGSHLREGLRVAIIGAGFIGLEMAEQLIHRGARVSVVEMQPQVLPQLDAEMVRPLERELAAHGVELITGDGIAGFEGAEDHITARLASGRLLEADLVILSIGVRPENSLAKEAGLALGARGHILVNSHLQTSDERIYAVGDVCETADPLLGGTTSVPLGGPANRQGRCAADHIFLGNKAAPYPGSIGTAIVRVFGVAAGVTGVPEKRLHALGRPYQAVTVNGPSHASYYPGAETITLKLLWEPETGCILGAQACGRDGVDKRLDIVATAIRGNMTIDDLVHLELAYAPPFGSAKDVVNVAGFAACNIRDGFLKPIATLAEAGPQIIDVRPAPAVARKPVPGARNIPLGELRGRLEEIDRSQPVHVICQMGKTSYFAARILANNGFDAYSILAGAHHQI
ncbi:MAG: FAD-dependent oxidoreductase [Akkermansiaceae bacterium]|nr:FAD-dependent oxidoreductase [Akkermansiaceae bacterium]